MFHKIGCGFYSEERVISTRHKYYCFQFGKWEEKGLAHFDVWKRTKCDHAGFGFYLELFSSYVTMYLYDNRHWESGQSG